jgi:hypothetical protein
MAIFQVLEMGRPARYPEFAVHPSWANNEFNNFADAHSYALRWLGPMGIESGTLQIIKLQLNVPFKFADSEICIQEVAVNGHGNQMNIPIGKISGRIRQPYRLIWLLTKIYQIEASDAIQLINRVRDPQVEFYRRAIDRRLIKIAFHRRHSDRFKLTP